MATLKDLAKGDEFRFWDEMSADYPILNNHIYVKIEPFGLDANGSEYTACLKPRADQAVAFYRMDESTPVTKIENGRLVEDDFYRQQIKKAEKKIKAAEQLKTTADGHGTILDFTYLDDLYRNKQSRIRYPD